MLTQLEQSFWNRTGKRKVTPKGVDETHLRQFEACKLTLSIETFKPQCKKSHSETCNENHAEKTECQTLTPVQCVEIPF